MESDIEPWLEKFGDRWRAGDVEGVMELFSDGVDYFESPFDKLGAPEEIREEWEFVKEQENIELDFKVFSAAEDRYSVIWDLRYDYESDSRHFRGVYLIVLNSENKCTEFRQYGKED